MSEYMMKDLFNDGKYQEAIKFASDPAVRNQFNEWDYFYLSKCLYAQKNYEGYLTLYKEFHKKFPSSNLLNNNMGWSVYHVYLKNFDYERGNRRLYFERVDYILKICDDNQYSPNKFIVQKVVDDIFKQKLSVNINYQIANQYLSAVDPLKLDTTEKTVEVDGRIIKVASEREQWYSRKAKTLVELKEYEECLKCVDNAFLNVEKFHNNSNHWLNYRRALSYYGLGNLDQAEKICKGILTRFTHWCLYELLFDLANDKGEVDEALRYGVLCTTVDREHSLRVSFYSKFALFLMGNGYQEEAALTFKLVELLRNEKNWKSKPLPEGFTYPEEVASLDKKDVLKRLTPFWNKEKERGIEFYEGTIARILPNGNTGFIEDPNGNSYYFNVRDFMKKPQSIEEGLHVRYTLEERLDKSKGVMKPNAVQISFVR